MIINFHHQTRINFLAAEFLYFTLRRIRYQILPSSLTITRKFHCFLTPCYRKSFHETSNSCTGGAACRHFAQSTESESWKNQNYVNYGDFSRIGLGICFPPPFHKVLLFNTMLIRAFVPPAGYRLFLN